MTSPPPSIASFIAGQGDPSLGTGSEEDQAALLTYLKATYPDSSSHNDVTALPTGRYRSTPTPGPSDLPGPPPNDYTPYPSQHSPINPSIPIPSSLAALAAQSTATINIPNLSAEFDHNQIRSGTDDRGEMGGKRRKLPHERAGWKEMDREPKTKKKRGARRQGSEVEGNGNGNGNGGMDNMAYLTGHEPSQKMEQQGQMDSSSFEDQAGDVDQTGIHSGNQDHTDPNDPKSAPNKKARAEQNKRAQQVFRRKREEHIKKLEEEAAAATDLRHSLSLAESKLRELALSLEAEHIEKLALRLSLRNLSQLGTNVLDGDSALITQIGERPRQGVEETTGELDQAFRTLEAQSRELAKVNRNKKAS